MKNNENNKFYKTILGNNRFNYIDLGSRGGLSEEWSKVEDVIDIILFEPEAQEAKKLQELASNNTTVIPSAVWSFKGEVSFHSLRNPSYSSVLKPDKKVLEGSYYYCRNFYEIDNVSKVQVDILEDILKDHGIEQMHFLKIDIQGAESYVYNSITSWADIVGIHTEGYSAKLYEEGNDIAMTLSKLYQYGFELFDIATIAESPIVEVDGDCISSNSLLGVRPKSGYRARKMVHDMLLFQSQIESLEKNDSKFIRRLIFIYCVYDYYDFALQAAEKAFELGILQSNEKKEIFKSIKALHQSSLSFLNRMKEKLKSPSYKLAKR